MQPRMVDHKVRNIKVRMMRGGAGEPLVFLHGAGGLPQWNAFVQGLAGRFDVFMPEHPGFGASDTPATIRNIADMAMYYLDFLDGLGVHKAHLVGASLGGWIAAEAAIRNLSHIESLSLLAPAGLRVKGEPIGDNFIWSPEENARNSVHNQELAEAMITASPSQEEADWALKNKFMVTKLAWEPRWFDPALERWLHRITVPTLVLWGEQDRLFPASYGRAWATNLPSASLEILPNTGHLIHRESGEEASNRILAFLGRR